MRRSASQRSVADLVFEGGLLFLALRVFSRVLGFAAFAVKARVLTPHDFGLIGTLALVTGFVGILGAHGVFDRLVRMPEMTEADIHRAWTLNALFNLGIAATLVVLSEPAARFLREPDLAAALRVTALRPIITALASPIHVHWARALRFRPMVLFAMLTRLMDVVLSTAGAVILRSYWGLLYGTLLAIACQTVLTYVLLPFLPRPRLDKSGAFLAFSLWSLVHSLAKYFAMSADELIVRRRSDTGMFGLYHVSRDLSRIFVSELVLPVAEPLLAGLARIFTLGAAHFRAAVMKAIAAAALVSAAVGFGMSATAAEAVAVVLGGRWQGSVPILQVIALGVAALAVAELHRPVMVAFGRIQISTLLWVGRAVVQIAVSVVGFALGGAHGVAAAFSLSCTMLLFVDYAVVFRSLGGRAATAFAVLWRPILAGAVMLAALFLLPWPTGWPVLAAAFAKIAVGAATYGAVVMLTWRAAGRPQGGESVLLERLPAPVRQRITRIIGAPAAPAVEPSA
ncbi:MAG: oligosaccharide flippase family protein [Elioraea sp.]|nr:oligosaccharide flippase family protein [Elioraea sp.]